MLNKTHAAVASLGLTLVPPIHTLLVRKAQAQVISEAEMDEANLNARVSSILDRKLGEELQGLTTKLMDETKKMYEKLFTEFQSKITNRISILEEDMEKRKEMENATAEKIRALESENSKIKEFIGPLVTRINNLEHDSKREAINSAKKAIVIRGLKTTPKDIKSLEDALDHSKITNEMLHITPLNSANNRNVIKITCKTAASRNMIRANIIAAIRQKGLKGISIADYIPSIFSNEAQSLIDKGNSMKKENSISFFSISMLNNGPRLFIKTSQDKHFKIVPANKENQSVNNGGSKRGRTLSSETQEAEVAKERRFANARRTKLFASGSQDSRSQLEDEDIDLSKEDSKEMETDQQSQ